MPTLSAATALIAPALLGFAIWPFFGPNWALLAVCAVLGVMLIRQLGQVTALLRWAKEPIGSPVPDGFGIWQEVFSALHRRARQGSDMRQKLAAALDRLREASQAMPDGMIIVSGDDQVQWFNSKAAAQFGLDLASDLGLPLLNIVRQPDFAQYLQSGTFSDPLVMRSPRMHGHTLAIQIIPFGEDQKLIMARDITHLEKLETMRRDFVANVSHELRTPLTVVTGFLELLLDEPALEGEHRRYLELAQEQTTRMGRLVEDLLTLSALETGAPAPAEERVALESMLNMVLDEARAISAGRHQISLEIRQPAQLLGSAKELHSAFSNLASNAVRYTPEGGSVQLIWSIEDGAGVFSVIDSGIGIDPQHIPRLTERFYRVDRGRSRETGGTGLGLAIVKHVLERHQGHLKITSEPGRGSCFAAQLPATRVRV
ncbi:MAG: phosphate regulon sensor histidine kinase PhoR [Pseudomonadota bacterium]|jgi:two-component system phosphate regulon sensor histidine kinase PhoR